jgi:hypothetical protein
VKKEDDRTIPWNDYELIKIGKLKLCYDFVNKEMMVRFPGGKCLPLGMIKGSRIIPPENIRDFR